MTARGRRRLSGLSSAERGALSGGDGHGGREGLAGGGSVGGGGDGGGSVWAEAVRASLL